MFFVFFRRLLLFYHFFESLSRSFFIFFKNFQSVYFVEIIDFVFLQDFYKFIISFIFCQELFYNFLTFNILKCLIVRLLLKKTFIILSSVLLYVNTIYKKSEEKINSSSDKYYITIWFIFLVVKCLILIAALNLLVMELESLGLLHSQF